MRDNTMNLERRLLNKIIAEKRLKEFSKLSPFLFVEERNFYEDINNYIKKYGVLPSIDVNTDDTPYSFLFEELLKVRLNEAITHGSERAKLLIEEGKVAEAISELYNHITKIDVIRNSNSLFTIADMGDMVIDYIVNNRIKEGMIGIPSGWQTLDKKTAGFQGGNIYVVLARPKMGKSISLTYMSNYAYEKGYNVLVVSMEMKALEMARRYWAIRAGISMNAMKEGRISTFAEMKLRDEVKKLQRISGKLSFLEGQFKKTVGELSSIVLSLKPDIVFIDGGYLLKIMGSVKMAKWEKMTEIIEDLKYLTITSNIPIVVSFQFHREAERKNQRDVGLGNIQLSDAIAQIASVGIGIFKDADEKRRLIEIVGGREGEEGEFLIKWDWDKMDFSEVENGGENAEGEDKGIIENIEN